MLNVAATILIVCLAAVAEVGEIAEADKLLLRGNYEEAAAAYDKLAEELAVPAAIGKSRCLVAVGKVDEATAVLDKAIGAKPQAAALLESLAETLLLTGDEDKAEEYLRASRVAGKQTARRRWLQIELALARGNIREAAELCQWFADVWDARGRIIDSSWELYWLGLGLAEHARLNRDVARFPQLVNQLYPQALKLNPDFWHAHHEMGRLLAEKHNDADAAEAFADALRINPRAADVHVAFAQLAIRQFQLREARGHIERALGIDPQHAGAHCAMADVEFASLNPEAARRRLKLALERNPKYPAALGRLAAANLLLDAAPLDDGLQPTGAVFVAAADALELSRRYPQAARAYARAIEIEPLLVGPRAQLGMNEMRLGHERRARKWMTEAFQIDPYNVRVKNQLDVLDLLDDYERLITPHFEICYDKDHDRHLAASLAEHAEACYAEFADLFDYELPERALLEVFRSGRGHTGSEWFGVRMAGLPNIHTIAACGGNIVAMQSPGERPTDNNWADVLRHEIVHLFNVQQTRYNVPHWFTEGCAVYLENRPRRRHWLRLLVSRGPKGDVFNLSTLNEAFLRPRSADDWQLAYCQAETYVECLIEEFGEEVISRIVTSYRDGLSTPAALERACGVAAEEVEARYAEFLDAEVQELMQRRTLASSPKLAELEQQRTDAPSDPAPLAGLALARLKRGDYAEAGRLAAAALKLDPASPTARLVRAKLLLRIGDEAAALPMLGALTSGAEDGAPLPEAIELLAGIRRRQGKLDEAARWYARGAELEPDELSWTKARLVVALKQDNDALLMDLLSDVAASEPDNLPVRKKRLQLAEKNGEPEERLQWAIEVLHIDPRDGPAQRALAEAADERQDFVRAATHYELAAELLPDSRGLKQQAARAWRAAGRPKRAVNVFENVTAGETNP